MIRSFVVGPDYETVVAIVEGELGWMNVAYGVWKITDRPGEIVLYTDIAYEVSDAPEKTTIYLVEGFADNPEWPEINDAATKNQCVEFDL